MTWFTSDQIPERSDMINGRNYVKPALEAVACTTQQSAEEGLVYTRVYIEGTSMVAEGVPSFNLPLTEKVIWLDACYDQINRINAAWIEGGILKHYWYDPTVPAFVVTELGPAERCFLFMDDVRFEASYTLQGSKIFLVYETAGELRQRVQSDRYEAEEVITLLQPQEHLVGAGMNALYRVQLVLEQEYFETTWADEQLDPNVYTIDSTDLLIGTEYVTLEDM